MVGWSSTPKKSLERMWVLRVSSWVSIELASISTSRVDSSGTSAIVATPLTSGNRPRTLCIRWRAMNSNDWWDRSISHVPTSGTGRPLTTRVPGVVPTPSLLLVSSLGTDDLNATVSATTRAEA